MHINYDSYEDKNKIQEMIQDLSVEKLEQQWLNKAGVQDILLDIQLQKLWEENNNDL